MLMIWPRRLRGDVPPDGYRTGNHLGNPRRLPPAAAAGGIRPAAGARLQQDLDPQSLRAGLLPLGGQAPRADLAGKPGDEGAAVPLPRRHHPHRSDQYRPDPVLLGLRCRTGLLRHRRPAGAAPHRRALDRLATGDHAHPLRAGPRLPVLADGPARAAAGAAGGRAGLFPSGAAGNPAQPADQHLGLRLLPARFRPDDAAGRLPPHRLPAARAVDGLLLHDLGRRCRGALPHGPTAKAARACWRPRAISSAC